MGALQVRHEPSSASVVRERIVEDLGRYGVPYETVELIILVASELVGNAVLHSSSELTGTLDVNWDVDSTGVTVCVADASTQLPRRREARHDESSGRGLAIVDAIADDWGVDFGPRGKQVWAHIPAGSSSTPSTQRS